MSKTWLISAVFTTSAIATFVGCQDSARPDPAVAKVEELRDSELPRIEKMTEAERDESRVKLQQQVGGLTKEQRKELFEKSGAMFAAALVRDVDRILALPADKQRSELDRKIDEFRERNAKAPKQEPAPADPKRAEEMRKRVLGTLSAEDRQKFETYRTKLVDRMKERGLPSDTDIF